MDIIGAPLVDSAAFAIASGLALAATCGLRTFLPVLAVAVLGYAGLLPTHPAAAWLISPIAVGAFAVLAAVELAADKIPGVDHWSDAIGFAVKPVAAMVVAIGVMRGIDPWSAGMLGAVAGGSAAMALGVGKAKLRLLSTEATRGVGNVVLSLVEDGAAILAIALAILAPPLAAVGLVTVGAAFAAAGTWGRRQRWARAAAA